MEPIIRTEGLAKMYQVGDNEVHALRGVTLSVMPGEFIAVMGPSGSGKSTFMNMVGCLDKPSAGRYWLAGEPVHDMERDQLASVRNRRIGFVFQQFNLLPRTSALENLALPLLYANVKKNERLARATKRLEQVGLSTRMDHHPAQLSGGQQQRVAIARSLVNDPALVLADEPTGALDTKTSSEVMALLQKLNDEGITIVLVTHEHDIAQHAKRIVLFRDGLVISDQPNQERRADLTPLVA